MSLRKIGIIGTADTSRDQAPWDDPEWELWGTPRDTEGWPHFKLLFEMHDILVVRQQFDAGKYPGYLERLQHIDQPIFMPAQCPEVPRSVTYPLDEVTRVGRDYFHGTGAYQLAFAAWQLPHVVGLWGVDLADERYGHQVACANYWLGQLDALGVAIVLPESCPLLKYDPDVVAQGVAEYHPRYPERYGYV